MVRHLRGRDFGSRPRGKTGLIICEGTRTEPRYLDALKQRLRLGGLDVRGMAKDPETLIDEAVAIRRRHEKAGNEPYDATWLVFDSERPGTFDIPALLRRAKSEKIETALSGPSFELWLLLHHEFTTARLCKGDVLRRSLPGSHRPGPGQCQATTGATPADWRRRMANHRHRCRLARTVDEIGIGLSSRYSIETVRTSVSAGAI
jgi:hypothetical protein